MQILETEQDWLLERGGVDERGNALEEAQSVRFILDVTGLGQIDLVAKLGEKPGGFGEQMATGAKDALGIDERSQCFGPHAVRQRCSCSALASVKHRNRAKRSRVSGQLTDESCFSDTGRTFDERQSTRVGRRCSPERHQLREFG